MKASQILPLLFIVPALHSCKAVERYKASPDFPADCAAFFPIKSDTVYRPGRVDTLPGKVIDCDSVTAQYEAWWMARQVQGVDTIWIDRFRPATRVQCPPATVRVDSVVVVQENIARAGAAERTVAALNEELIKHKDATLQAQDKANKWRRWCLITWGLIALGVGIRWGLPWVVKSPGGLGRGC